MGRNRDDNPDHRDGKDFEGRTYLYIRTHPADMGDEPLPGGLPGWISPDITIIKPDGARGTEAVTGQVNQVEVIVRNLGGITATDAYLEVYVADPSTAFTPTTATPIGSTFITVPGYSAATVALPWTPLASEAGHRCLLARVCLTIPPDCYVNSTIFDVIGDRHVAQRNISVVALAQNMQRLSFGFLITNPFGEAAEFRIQGTELRITQRAMQIVRGALGCGFVQFGQTPLQEIGLTIADTPREGRYWSAMPVGPLRKAAEDLGRARASVKLEPGEARYAVLTVGRNPETRPGDVHVVQIAQIDSRTRQPVGGLWLVVQH